MLNAQGYRRAHADIAIFQEIGERSDLLTPNDLATYEDRYYNAMRSVLEYRGPLSNPVKKVLRKEGTALGTKQARKIIQEKIAALPEDSPLRDKYDPHLLHADALRPPVGGEVVPDGDERIRLWQKEVRSIDRAADRMREAEQAMR